MAPPEIDVLVFDILGTLVDERGGLRAAIAAAAPSQDPSSVEDLLGVWKAHVKQAQRSIVDGQRDYASSDVLDAEAADLVAERTGVTGPAVVAALASATRRLSPWPDTRDGLARLAERHPLVGLTNAGRRTLLRLNAHAGLRWHQALSAEAVSTYKPDPAAYHLAVDVAGVPPDRLMLVAAHPWDLRGAAAVGLRTAHVTRPGGEQPEATDRFDFSATGLEDLAGQL